MFRIRRSKFIRGRFMYVTLGLVFGPLLHDTSPTTKSFRIRRAAPSTTNAELLSGNYPKTQGRFAFAYMEAMYVVDALVPRSIHCPPESMPMSIRGIAFSYPRGSESATLSGKEKFPRCPHVLQRKFTVTLLSSNLQGYLLGIRFDELHIAGTEEVVAQFMPNSFAISWSTRVLADPSSRKAYAVTVRLLSYRITETIRTSTALSAEWWLVIALDPSAFESAFALFLFPLCFGGSK